ncbi:MAG: hypothetical protein N3H31_07220 [Candidatus Nezhaarchaeota archaeon]|nr:hypothetical protein [Candidatus Nezhaarchaeota archaeon]
MESLKKEFIELLDKDLEFRYAVAGYLGLSEVLKRLDSLAEEQVKLREEVAKIWGEIAALRGEQVKVWDEIKALREEVRALREDFNKAYVQLDARLAMVERTLETRLTRVERTLEKLTLDIEEEARIVVKHRLRDMGYEVEVGLLVLPELEVNLYGAIGDLCVVGEASVRASSKIIDEVDQKVERLGRLYPDRLRPRVVKVVYTSLALPDLVERAEREGVWVLKATGDVVKPRGLP